MKIYGKLVRKGKDDRIPGCECRSGVLPDLVGESLSKDPDPSATRIGGHAILRESKERKNETEQRLLE